MNKEDSILLTAEFWTATGIRALRTFAQSLAGTITIGLALAKWDWKLGISISLLTTLYTVLTAVAFPGKIPEIKPKEGDK